MAERKTAPEAGALSSGSSVAVATLADLLIPGDGIRWPRFGDAVVIDVFLVALDDAERSAFTAAPPDPAAWERDAPDAFALALRAVHRAYYTAPLVLAAVRSLAEESPREPDPWFDPQLVAAVVANARGRRRY